MNIKVRLPGILCILAAIMLGLFSLRASTTVQAIGPASAVDGSLQPASQAVLPAVVPGGPGFISVMGAAFTPGNDSYLWSVNAGELSNPDTVNDGYYIAPVMLPQGAIVKQMVVFYNDLREDNLTVTLHVKTNDESFWALAMVNSEGAGGYGSSFTNTIFEEFKTIDNQNCAYALDVIIPKKTGTSYNNLYLVRVRIDYDYPVYLPTVQK